MKRRQGWRPRDAALVLVMGWAAMVSATAQTAPTTAATASPAGDALRPGAVAAVLPPTIQDLAVLLRSYRPDAQRVQQLRALLAQPLSPALTPAQQAVALHEQANAADELQDVARRLELLQAALSVAPVGDGSGQGQVGGYRRLRQEQCGALRPARGVAVSQDACQAFVAELEAQPQGKEGWLIGVYREIGRNALQLGDLDTARAALARMDTALQRAGRQRDAELRLPNWRRETEWVRAEVAMAQARWRDAENALLTAIREQQEAIRLLPQRQARGIFAPPLQRAGVALDELYIRLAQVLVEEDRVDEGELMLREVLKRSLVRDGRNGNLVGKSLKGLAEVMLRRSRPAEAVVLMRWADQTWADAGMAELSPPRANGQIVLANALVAAGRAVEAVAVIDGLRNRLGDDPRLEAGFGRGTPQTVRAYLQAGRLDDALRDAQGLLATRQAAYGRRHYLSAEALAVRGMVWRRLGRPDDARRDFDAALPLLLDPALTPADSHHSGPRLNRLQALLGEQLALLAGPGAARSPADLAQAFLIGDVARWQSVQRAVADSAVRSAAGTPELAARIKSVQDADDEVQAVYKNLIALRSAPPERQLPAVVQAMEARIAMLQQQREAALADIRRQFPQYDALVNPRPADVAAARRSLKPNEALLSVYVQEGGSYVWALGPDGQLRFHHSPRGRAWLAEQVRRLRESVDLSSGVPAERLGFDLAAGHALYAELLAPVQAAWQDRADTLVVVANDVLGQVPFSMLPTAAVDSLPKAAGPALSQYRQVPWLARQVAVAYLPSVSSLVTLRALPAPRTGRAPFIGFGDPDFGGGAAAPTGGTRNLSVVHAPNWNPERVAVDITPSADARPPAAEVLAAPVTVAPAAALASAPVPAPVPAQGPAPSSAPPSAAALAVAPAPAPALPELQLVPLPDTRDEILAIAQALGAKEGGDLYFGARATPQAVRAAELQRRRIVAFATHGLVAGDLPGLSQPALALSPAPGQPLASGLLQLDDILKLSLDADLVVLSACNTAAADGAGSEAVSGLGRGFFHAGARSVLATHWPVETVSARLLVSGLFERYAQDPTLTRAQALRRAMLHLIDEAAATDGAGRPALSYAHPAFWSPYALYGDPGR